MSALPSRNVSSCFQCSASPTRSACSRTSEPLRPLRTSRIAWPPSAWPTISPSSTCLRSTRAPPQVPHTRSPSCCSATENPPQSSCGADSSHHWTDHAPSNPCNAAAAESVPPLDAVAATHQCAEHGAHHRPGHPHAAAHPSMECSGCQRRAGSASRGDTGLSWPGPPCTQGPLAPGDQAGGVPSSPLPDTTHRHVGKLKGRAPRPFPQMPAAPYSTRTLASMRAYSRLAKSPSAPLEMSNRRWAKP